MKNTVINRFKMRLETCRRLIIFTLAALFLSGSIGWSSSKTSAAADSSQPSFTVVKAIMAENIDNLNPVHPTVIFSAGNEKAYCYTQVEGIEAETHLYHHWIRRDMSITKVKLLLKPPIWSTFSSISLREVDKGPWRVEITDSEGTVLKTLRFSVVD